MSAPTHVRAVRARVRDGVRAQTPLAVGLCGMCGHFRAFTGARTTYRHAPVYVESESRAYECPHIPHIPHNADAAMVSRHFDPAHASAHPAHRARARFSMPLVPNEIEEEGCW